MAFDLGTFEANLTTLNSSLSTFNNVADALNRMAIDSTFQTIGDSMSKSDTMRSCEGLKRSAKSQADDIAKGVSSMTESMRLFGDSMAKIDMSSNGATSVTGAPTLAPGFIGPVAQTPLQSILNSTK